MQDLEYRDGILVAGSLDALVELLMPTESHYPEKTYTYAFILCSRLFIRPYELLARVSRVRILSPPCPASVLPPPSLLLILFCPPSSFAFLLSPSLPLSPPLPLPPPSLPRITYSWSHLPADISRKIETSDNIREITDRRLRSIRYRAYGVSIPH